MLTRLLAYTVVFEPIYRSFVIDYSPPTDLLTHTFAVWNPLHSSFYYDLRQSDYSFKPFTLEKDEDLNILTVFYS